MYEKINTVYKIDNIKFDRQTNSLYAGTNYNSMGTIQALKSFPKNSKVGVGGLTEYGRDPATLAWWMKEHVVTNIFNGISNSIRVNNTLIGGSFFDKGILSCQYNKNTKEVNLNDIGGNYTFVIIIFVILLCYYGIVRCCI